MVFIAHFSSPVFIQRLHKHQTQIIEMIVNTGPFTK